MAQNPRTKKEAFQGILRYFGTLLSSAGCNDFTVDNTPEMFLMLEQAGADDVGMSLEDFRKSDQYEDYGPRVSADRRSIYTQDWVILAVLKREIGL